MATRHKHAPHFQHSVSLFPSGATCYAGYFSDPVNSTATSANEDLASCVACPCTPEHSVKIDDATNSNGDPTQPLFQCANLGDGQYQCKCKSGYTGPACNVSSNDKAETALLEVLVASLAGTSLLVIGCVLGWWLRRKRKRRLKRQQQLANMRFRLLKRFPNLAGLEGLFMDADGIGEWLIPFSDIDVGEIIGAGASAMVLKGRYADGLVAVKRLNAVAQV